VSYLTEKKSRIITKKGKNYQKATRGISKMMEIKQENLRKVIICL